MSAAGSTANAGAGSSGAAAGGSNFEGDAGGGALAARATVSAESHARIHGACEGALDLPAA
eukprot:5869571-Pleurochrysis_carterae.AAC.1